MSQSEQSAKPTGAVVAFPTRTVMASEGTAMPAFTWEALEQQLSDLAVTPTQRALTATLISGTRKQAAFKPADLVLREILCIASVLMDETFHPERDGSEGKEGEMT